MARPAVQATRRRFLRHIQAIPVDRLVFLDESGVHVAMSRSHTWVKRGTEFIDPVPMNWGKTLTLLGAIRRTGWVVLRTMFATANADRFVAWLTRHLLPKLRPGEVLVMDNLRAHKTGEVQTVLEKSSFAYRYLPSYSPDLNPIEPGWAKLKSDLRRVAARTVEALEQALGPALNSITAQDAAGFFRHCGYHCLN